MTFREPNLGGRQTSEYGISEIGCAVFRRVLMRPVSGKPVGGDGCRPEPAAHALRKGRFWYFWGAAGKVQDFAFLEGRAPG